MLPGPQWTRQRIDPQEENEMKCDRDDPKVRPSLLNPAIHRKAPVQPSAARDGMDVPSCDFASWKIAFSTLSGWLRMWTILCVTVVLGLAGKICAGQTTIASKQNHDFHILLTRKWGKLVAEKDEYCALFDRTGDDEPAVVGDVFLDFAQQVGRIRESPSERLKRGEFEDLENFRGFGHLLISLRIAKGVSQRELTKRLSVHESQVSRDERNEYFGITLERAIKILDALNVRLHTKVEIEPPRAMAMA
jgi:ribosome-binding protein aMBF1 (putative translation factor)